VDDSILLRPGRSDRHGVSAVGLLLIAGLLLGSGWILFLTGRRLMARRSGWAPWLLFVVLVGFGCVVGYRGCLFQYQASPHLQLVGVPLPVCVFHFESGQWVDFPSQIGNLVAAANIAAITALAVLPFWLGLRWGDRGTVS
jgi:hypothetical protein